MKIIVRFIKLFSHLINDWEHFPAQKVKGDVKKK